MDQTMPSFCLNADVSNYTANFYETFPFQELDPEYDVSAHYMHHDGVHSNTSGVCVMPNSPPETIQSHYAISLPMHAPPPYQPDNGCMHTATNVVGIASGVIPIPLPKKATHGSHLHGTKRARGLDFGSSSHSSASGSSPASINSMNGFKQEDDLDSNFPVSSAYGPSTGHPYQLNDDSSYYPVGLSDEGHRNIAFRQIFDEQCCEVVDQSGQPAKVTELKVQADKGFNFSQMDDAFICQKKNHFQLTVQVLFECMPHFVRANPNTPYQEVRGYTLDLFGVKTESIQQRHIKIEQSQSDRSRKPFVPYTVTVSQLQQQHTIARLHFSETTANNMRKKGKPNPDQKFFRLVVALYANVAEQDGRRTGLLMSATGSENIVVRASNPGQFETDSAQAPAWQKAENEDDAIFHIGNIGINNERPEDALDIRGNMRLTGRLIRPSDARAKDILVEVDSLQQLENIRNLRIYQYKYKPDVAQALNLTERSTYDTGVIAQEVLETIPEAVEIIGDLELANGEILHDFLMVDKDRVFMENVGAVKALWNVTEGMATQITELQKIGKRFAHLKLRDSFRSNISSVTAKSNCSSSAGSPYAGNSASARPSIISYKAPSKQADKSSISPSQLLGKNYLQWLTLCLVMLISICLIAMLALYITSKSDPDNDKISSTADLALGADTFPISFDANTANNQTFVGFPPILVQDGSEVWDNLWSTGHCKFVAPVALDPQCVSNATYAQSHCISWDFMDCCVDLGQSISKPTEEQLPGYHTENAALSQNLHVSFEKEFDARGDPSNIESRQESPSYNVIGQELDNGKAVLYQSEAAKKLQLELKALVNGDTPRYLDDSPCNVTDADYNDEWDLIKSIQLVEPGIKLHRTYCNSLNKPCGFNNTFVITVPLSRYYTLPNISVTFILMDDVKLAICHYKIDADRSSCYRSTETGASLQHRELEAPCSINLPIGTYSRSELEFRAISRRFAHANICGSDSRDVIKYRLVFVRSCRS